jgi:hypothetical protein
MSVAQRCLYFHVKITQLLNDAVLLKKLASVNGGEK